MKKAFAILIFLFLSNGMEAQIRFDISRIKKQEVDKMIRENKPNVVYLDMTYGGHEFLNEKHLEQIGNKIVQKVEYVYSDYPKDFDYTELVFQRFASLYTVLPQVFNKPWIEWSIVKQTRCSSSSEASKLFHGFIVTCKDGPEPNLQVKLSTELQQKLDNTDASVTFTEVTEEDLTKFLAPKEIRISNIQYPNKTKSIRLFNQLNPGRFNIAKGLFLTTGIPQGAIGPNNSPSVSSVNAMQPTPDKNLSALVGKGQLFDASIVEFDVQIAADSLVFRYAFASEEYPEYLQFNDVFGLFISGPGLNGINKDTTINLAVLPDQKTPVSVSSINHLKNTDCYLANDDSDLKLFKTWQYDGFSKVMVAKVKVNRNQKYHIKLAIADYGDPFYDSGIFIDAFGIKSKK